MLEDNFLEPSWGLKLHLFWGWCTKQGPEKHLTTPPTPRSQPHTLVLQTIAHLLGWSFLANLSGLCGRHGLLRVILMGQNPTLLPRRPETSLFPAHCPETVDESRFLHRDIEAQADQQRPPDNSGGINVDVK